ncbi:uncharacterized protein LOC110982253 [Acanthaster planci]|uniref:Uncharacterized protein LOC110982253 n=1 Tax=Acanthaster planci TaxID=133434 RepID=A0A8B7YUS9_ACAPL|nr:uncharacterized protein LOC110982253 [Acanthaster planci]
MKPIMERRGSWFKVKVILLVVAVCLETTGRTKQVKGQRALEAERSLVAVVEDGQQGALQSGLGLKAHSTESMGNVQSAEANPSRGAEAVELLSVQENNNPQPSEVKQNKWIFDRDGAAPREMSITEVLHLLGNGQMLNEARTWKSLQGAYVYDKQRERFQGESLLQGENEKGLISKMLSENSDRRVKKNAYRMRREAPITNDSPSKVHVSPTPSGAGDIHPSNISRPTQSDMTSKASEDEPSSLAPVLSGDVLSPLPITASSHDTKEPVRTTHWPEILHEDITMNKRPTTPPTPVQKQPELTLLPKVPSTTKTQGEPSPNRGPVVHRTTPSSTLEPTAPSTTNASSISPESKIKERTLDNDCVGGNCDATFVGANQWTDDAYWAFGSLLTILLLLTAGVLYTGLWRKRNHMSNPISDVNCHAQVSPSRKSKTDIKDLLKKKLLHIKSLNNSPLSSPSTPPSGKPDTSQHNGGTSRRSSNGRAGNRYSHRYDRLPLLAADENEEEEFSREWGPQA